MAVSPNGVVQLVADTPRWDEIFGREKAEATELVIRPDLEKLDIADSSLIPLANLRAADSGRTSGPKGANLGELKHYFGEAVPNGFVIPFGIFRKLLDQPLEPGGPPVFEWMKQNYEAIDKLDGRPQEQEQHVKKFLARLRAALSARHDCAGDRPRIRRDVGQNCPAVQPGGTLSQRPS